MSNLIKAEIVGKREQLKERKKINKERLEENQKKSEKLQIVSIEHFVIYFTSPNPSSRDSG